MNSPTQYYIQMIKDLKNELLSVVDRYTVLKVTAAGLVGFSILYGIKIWNSQRYFARRGIKTPKYHLIGGNLPEIFRNTYSESLKAWTEKYGKTYGIYEGTIPMLITSDLDIIEEVFYKQFSCFTGRKKFPFQLTDQGPKVNLFMASKNRWKRMRAIINPTFAPARLRELAPDIKKCVKRLDSVVEKNLDREINISDFFDRMVMDVVWNCGYGIDIDFQSNPNDSFFVRAIKNFEYVSNLHFTVRMLMCFTELKPYMLKIIMWYTYFANKINTNFGNPFFLLVTNIHKILTERLKRKVFRKDYAQILINAQSDDFKIEDVKGNFVDDYDPTNVEKKLTYNEVLMNLMMFLLAGYETTSVTMAILTHLLAQHPDEMHKLQAELEHLTIDNLNYETVGNLEYMDMFIKEAQRMYPVSVISTVRKCTSPTKVCGIEMEKDLLIGVDVLSLHYNPEYWGQVDPNIFYPMRFAAENNINKLVYMPFGAGPRSCIGFRFALLEIKLTLSHLLKKYDICAPENGLAELKLKEGIVRRPKNGVRVVLKKRDVENKSFTE